MECFGKYEGNREECVGCEYNASCETACGLEKSWKESERAWRWRRSPTAFRDSSDDEIIEQADKRLDSLLMQDAYSREDLLEVVSIMLRVAENSWLLDVLKKRLAGVSFANIAKEQGVSRQAIHLKVGTTLEKILGYRQRAKAAGKKKSGALLDFETLEHRTLRIIHLRKKGYSYRRIAQELRCSQKTVRKALIEAKKGEKESTCSSKNKKK